MTVGVPVSAMKGSGLHKQGPDSTPRSEHRGGWGTITVLTPTRRRSLAGTQFPQLSQSAGQAQRGEEEPVAVSLG